MMRTGAIAALIGACLACAGCAPTSIVAANPTSEASMPTNDELPGVDVTTEKGRYTGDVRTIQATWRNDGDKILTFGCDWTLERCVDEVWMPVGSQDVAFTSIGYDLEPGETRDMAYDVQLYADALAEGDYRIRVRCLDVREPGDYDEYVLYAPFEVIAPQSGT